MTARILYRRQKRCWRAAVWVGLVHFVRRLPKLTDQELERMEALNPKTQAELKDAEEARRFLEGGSSTSPNESQKEHQD